MKFQVETITPQLAENILATNHQKQRNASASHVLHLANQIASGQWVMNGEPIIIDDSGNLLDGQHRMMAVIQAQKPVEMLVVRGMTPCALPTINTGKPRSPGDTLRMSGKTNANDLAACLAGVWNYRRALKVEIRKDGVLIGTGGSLNSYLRQSRPEMLDEYEKNSDIYDIACRIGMSCGPMVGRSTVSTVAALAIMDGSRGLEWVKSFWESVASGLDLTSTSPAYHLRERLIANRNARQKFSKNHALLLCAKAWNFCAMEKPCKLLRLTDERVFPIL